MEEIETLERERESSHIPKFAPKGVKNVLALSGGHNTHIPFSVDVYASGNGFSEEAGAQCCRLAVAVTLNFPSALVLRRWLDNSSIRLALNGGFAINCSGLGFGNGRRDYNIERIVFEVVIEEVDDSGARKYSQAIDLYTQAIELNGGNAVYYSNRAFAHLRLEEYGSAIQDASKAIEIDPKYSKGYYRRGAAYIGLGKFKEALKDFQQMDITVAEVAQHLPKGAHIDQEDALGSYNRIIRIISIISWDHVYPMEREFGSLEGCYSCAIVFPIQEPIILVRPVGSVRDRSEMEGKLNALEGRMEGRINEGLKAETMGLQRELREFMRMFGERGRNAKSHWEGSQDSVNGIRGERREDDEEDTSGEQPNWVKRVELATFEGINPLGWISHVEKFFEIQKVTKREKLRLAYVCMEGSTSYWYRFWKKKTQAPTWEGLREALIRRFGGRDRGTVFERLAAVKQNNTVDEYIQDFEMLVAHTKVVSEGQLLGYFFAGLQGVVRSQIRPHNPRDLFSAMEVARDVDEASRGARMAGGTGARSGQWDRHCSEIGTDQTGFGMIGGSREYNNDSKRSSTMSDDRGRGIRKLPYPEYVRRREEGLCFHCGGPYSPGHCCPEKSLRVVIMGEDEIGDEEEEGGEEGEPKRMELSSFSVSGLTPHKTMKLQGWVRERGGTSHNFIATGLVKRLGLSVEDTPPYRVPVNIGETEVMEQFCLFELGEVDLIFGMEWLAKLGEVEKVIMIKGDPTALEPKTFVNIKVGDGMTMGWTFGKEEIENPRQQQREEVKPHVGLVVVAMAEHLPSMFGTGTVMVNCPFYFKRGACRHTEHKSDHSALQHVLALRHDNPGGDAHGNPLDHRQIQDDFEEFYEDIFEELSKYGEIESLKVCDNLADHMAGNVYVKFKEEEHAANVASDRGLLVGDGFSRSYLQEVRGEYFIIEGTTVARVVTGITTMTSSPIVIIVESTMTGTTIKRVVVGNARVRVLNLEEEMEVRDGGSTADICEWQERGRKGATWVDDKVAHQVVGNDREDALGSYNRIIRIIGIISWDHVYPMEREFGSLEGCYSCAVAILNREYTDYTLFLVYTTGELGTPNYVRDRNIKKSKTSVVLANVGQCGLYLQPDTVSGATATEMLHICSCIM
ncbi:hypothetical protein V8G54_031656 [Vigna mungo]|uniref:Ty3 transposon capsid-like protein domain-containing protein n=1 Tax=Vigna mungo TaxID=3915 RepID=A0AAQ3RER0_VIGMU